MANLIICLSKKGGEGWGGGSTEVWGVGGSFSYKVILIMSQFIVSSYEWISRSYLDWILYGLLDQKVNWLD